MNCIVLKAVEFFLYLTIVEGVVTIAEGLLLLLLLSITSKLLVKSRWIYKNSFISEKKNGSSLN